MYISLLALRIGRLIRQHVLYGKELQEGDAERQLLKERNKSQKFQTLVYKVFFYK